MDQGSLKQVNETFPGVSKVTAAFQYRGERNKYNVIIVILCIIGRAHCFRHKLPF